MLFPGHDGPADWILVKLDSAGTRILASCGRTAVLTEGLKHFSKGLWNRLFEECFWPSLAVWSVQVLRVSLG